MIKSKIRIKYITYNHSNPLTIYVCIGYAQTIFFCLDEYKLYPFDLWVRPPDFYPILSINRDNLDSRMHFKTHTHIICLMRLRSTKNTQNMRFIFASGKIIRRRLPDREKVYEDGLSRRR